VRSAADDQEAATGERGEVQAGGAGRAKQQAREDELEKRRANSKPKNDSDLLSDNRHATS